MIFELSPAATRDAERLREFLMPVSPTAATRAMNRIAAAIRSLDRFPDRGRPVPVGARDLIVPFGSSSYIVRYIHDREAGKIVVLRIWHGREDRT